MITMQSFGRKLIGRCGAIFAFTILAACSPSGDSEVQVNSVSTPSTVGLSQAGAESAIRGAGLVVGNVVIETSETIPEGSVISQDPPAGTDLPSGSAVDLIVSGGPADIPVPSTAGLSQAEAETALTNAGFVVGTVTTEASDTVPVGEVVRTDPSADTAITPGSTVNLIISAGPSNTPVPNVAGLSEADARAAIIAAGLTVGDIIGEASDVVPSGDVIRTDPQVDTPLTAGAPVNIVVSLGPANIAVPDVTNLASADAIAALNAVGLVVGNTTEQQSVDVPAGGVISQDPQPGTLVPAGAAIDLVISLGPDVVPVPDIVGLQQASAEAVVVNAGLTVGVISFRVDNQVPEGEVISQSLPPGQLVLPDTTINFVVSLGPPATVPDVSGLSEADAAITLDAARLVVGNVTTQNDLNVPAGAVISQNPVAGTIVDPGTAVDLVISLGPPTSITPNVVGLSQADAEQAIIDAELIVGTITMQPSTTVAAGTVTGQSPAPGAVQTVGSPVDIVVSSGPPQVNVPNVVGQTQAAAESTITGANLVVGNITTQSSSSVASGSVISQNPAAGASVSEGSAVDLVISTGPVSVSVPDVVGQTQVAAESAITGANLVVGTVTTQSSSSVASGSIISQSPAGGATVNEGSSVDLVVSTGPASVSVPNVVGLTQAAAESAITGANLGVGTVTTQSSNSVASGSVISQNPAAGATVSEGSSVDLVVSTGPASVSVPNVVGQTQTAAESAITGANLVVGTVSTQSSATVASGDVISQNPTAGTNVSEGTSVDIVVSTGPATSSFTDEFTSNSIADWSLLHQVESRAAQYSTLNIDTTVSGKLVIIPNPTPGWFGSGTAPLVYKEITGNFAIYTEVLARSLGSASSAPSSNFNSAGLLARDPAGVSGPENYVMVNVGRQDNRAAGGIGSEAKTTVNSSSTLTIDDGTFQGQLALCRVGSEIIAYRQLPGDADWIEINRYTRADLPSTLQVGMVANGFGTPVDLQAEFEYVRELPTPTNDMECTP